MLISLIAIIRIKLGYVNNEHNRFLFFIDFLVGRTTLCPVFTIYTERICCYFNTRIPGISKACDFVVSILFDQGR